MKGRVAPRQRKLQIPIEFRVSRFRLPEAGIFENKTNTFGAAIAEVILLSSAGMGYESLGAFATTGNKLSPLD